MNRLVECAWCGGEVISQTGEVISQAYPNRRGEVFCSKNHRTASNRALKRLQELDTTMRPVYPPYKDALEAFTEAAIDYVGAKKVYDHVTNNSDVITDDEVLAAAAIDHETASQNLLHAAEQYVVAIAELADYRTR